MTSLAVLLFEKSLPKLPIIENQTEYNLNTIQKRNIRFQAKRMGFKTLKSVRLTYTYPSKNLYIHIESDAQINHGKDFYLSAGIHIETHQPIETTVVTKNYFQIVMINEQPIRIHIRDPSLTKEPSHEEIKSIFDRLYSGHFQCKKPILKSQVNQILYLPEPKISINRSNFSYTLVIKPNDWTWHEIHFFFKNEILTISKITTKMA
jgi:hypothetical protein